ncbi:MAG: class I SAM-dependent methyltransferase [Dysgonamonadaceae bacterium]|jgi:SAM-dependent methyltransferase|nr:class I SAM-dependent methyltransferase [Dysgonamonadaceae bacterium]
MSRILIDNSTKNVQCPVCFSTNIHKIGDLQYDSNAELMYSTNAITLRNTPYLCECLECLSWFSQNIVSEADSIMLYSTGNSEKRWKTDIFENTVSDDILKIMKSILSLYKSANAKLLDIGCNTGELLDWAKANYHFDTFGLEYSESARKILINKTHTAYPSFNDISETFDIITAFDLVEHLYDFPDFMKHVEKLLKPNGMLLLLTGNNNCYEAKKLKNDWWYVLFPEHVIFPHYKAYENYDLKLYDYYKVSHFKFNKITLRSVIRKIIRLFSLRYSNFPFNADHHLIILQKKIT